MASLLNNASLLLNPAGSIIAYEEDKIFSVLPRNGAGDFTFSGGDGGTRVNQQGYVEVTPANLASDSNSFTNNSGFTKTGSLSGPFSSTDGNILTPVGSSEKYSGIASLTVTANTIYTFSVYAKYLQNTNLALRCVYSNGAQDESTIFNLQTNTIVGSIPSSHSNPQIIPVGGGWFRYSVDINSNTPPAFPLLFRVNAASGTNLVFTPSAGDGFYISSAQVNTGGLKPYQPTTDRLNYPRITYQNGRGALLGEPQRTNLTQGSNGLTTNWTNYRGTYTANAIMSPDGTVNAPRTVWDGSSPNTVGFYFTNFSFAGSTTYCFSVFLKYYNKPVISVGYVDRSGPYLGGNAYFNIANGTFVSVDGSATTGIIEPYKDGWYRCTVVFTTTASPSYNYLSVDSGNVVTGEGFYIYGSQLEVGSYPTSYIPTTSATVTRPTDSISNATSFQTSGVASNGAWSMILEGSEVTLTTQGFQFYSGGTYLGGHYGTTFIVINSSGGESYPFSLTEPRFRIGLSWNGTTLNAYENGINVLSTTNVLSAYNTFSTLLLYNGGGSKLSYPKAAIYNTALSTTQLQELTTYRSGSGGNISYYGPYTIHTFTGSATFTPSFNGEVEVLVVAGGGAGGGGDVGGGGGAGGLIYASSYGVSQGTGITVTIGAGGTGVANAGLAGGNGSNSVFGGLTAIGGGGGAGWTKGTGNDGGSGGGSTWYGVGGKGIPGQGNDGGTGGVAGPPYPQCGGGGAGEAGFPHQSSTVAGNGGDGLPYSISGFSTYYAGGGGGATEGNVSVPGTPGTGGLGGGGNGGSQGASILGTPGVNYTGGGGGGCDPQAGANGGSGVVIVRYLT